MYIARQRLGKQVFVTMDTQATLEELLGTMFSVRSVQNGNKRELVNWNSVGRLCECCSTVLFELCNSARLLWFL
jgi:hypothetical protein